MDQRDADCRDSTQFPAWYLGSLSVLPIHEDKGEGPILVQLIIGQLRLCHIQLTQKSFVRMRK